LGKEKDATCIMIGENAWFSRTLIPKEINLEVETLEDPDKGNMLPRE